MKPRLEYVFPGISTSGSSIINNIKLSKANRSMEIILDSDISDYELGKLEDEIKDKLNLTSVFIRTHNDMIQQRIWANANNYNKEFQEEIAKSLKINQTLNDENNKERKKAVIKEMIYGRSIRDYLTPISEITEESGYVCFYGEVIGVECKEIKSKKTEKEFFIAKFSVTDFQDSITAQLFIEKTEKKLDAIKSVSARLKKGMYVTVRGKAQYSEFDKEVTVSVNSIAEGYEPPQRMDNAEEKRVELHLHTQMSAMDGVSSAKDLINRAVKWGHKAIALTDHGVVQAFPDAMKASDLNKKIKVLYGMEGYLIDDSLKIMYNSKGGDIKSSFVVFDIETTGINEDICGITEIGAVKIENGRITDYFSTFVNPQMPIPKNIQELTGITDNMVKDAPTEREITPKFLEFSKGCVLVAHNAMFDTGFIRKNAKECNLEFDFPILDTLMLARCLYPNLNNHKLNTLTKHLNIMLENHHRAVDDAKATADIFIKMIEELENMSITELDELNSSFDLSQAVKKNKAYHIIILAKNTTGVRNLYEMVTASQLKYFHRTPRIPKSLLAEKREGLIIGSACEAGELFRAVVENSSKEKIHRIVEFYDYLEIQPIGNNAYMKREKDFPDVNTDEDLQNLNRKIVELGKMYNKPVCATCDVHFLDPEGANYRKILMYYKGFKDAVDQAPLFFRTTEEMLEEFSYLGKEKAYEVVVKNTNMIADMIDDVRPIPPTKCPPEIEGAQEDIINDSFRKACAIYGDPLPPLVKERLDKELHSITTYGFSVMYKIAQELVRKSLSDGYLVGSRGSVGSSFVAFLSDITEVNSLPCHYICPNCKNVEFIENETGMSGCDLPDKICPVCGTKYKKDGHDIPFETFLGFKGDKEPDIDLNFSGSYQPVIHKYTETFFGEGFVFRAGTIGTVAEKTAFGYVKKFAEENGLKIRTAEMNRLAAGCVGVKRTSGQHPGGIIVVPHRNDIHEFCPVQHPADDPNSDIITTHFDYHSIDQNLLKLDELGHDDPTVIKMLQDLTELDPQTIPLDDEDTLSLFTSNKALKIMEGEDIGTNLGTYGIPEFGTKFVRQMLEDTKPKTFSELVRISGLSHGTDVWLNNAQTLIQQGICDLSHSICTRDDIMLYLISMGVEAGHSFKIMESVRKGKGLKPEDEEAMLAAGVPDWYIDSCKKIKYMFPKAHAVAYVTMAFRVAYYKVHYPQAFYIAYFSVRADDFDASTMAFGLDVAKQAMQDLIEKKKNNTISPKEENVIPILEICIEMYSRGLNFAPIDLYKSHAVNFIPCEEGIRPPLNAIPGLGENVARSIQEARESAPFKTIDDLKKRTTATRTNIEIMQQFHCLDDLPESDQVTIFDI
ncbi:MAG: PolC-type DNA polymerase III [Clostridia bacterium]|nr:PolC-type DNA polymerase III [Clostridia bacterium]